METLASLYSFFLLYVPPPTFIVILFCSLSLKLLEGRESVCCVHCWILSQESDSKTSVSAFSEKAVSTCATAQTKTKSGVILDRTHSLPLHTPRIYIVNLSVFLYKNDQGKWYSNFVHYHYSRDFSHFFLQQSSCSWDCNTNDCIFVYVMHVCLYFIHKHKISFVPQELICASLGEISPRWASVT